MNIKEDLKQAQKNNSKLKGLPIKNYKVDLSDLDIFKDSTKNIDEKKTLIKTV